MSSRSADRPLRDPFGIVGTIVDGRYLVERVAARGGFSVVYRARHLGFDSLVALKVLLAPIRQDRATQSELTSALHAEGKILFELAPLHCSFVRVLELGSLRTPDGMLAPYLTLEWLEGTTLKEDARRLRLAGQRLDATQVLSLFDGIATGLAIAHDHGVAHRDVKPANVFLSRCGDQIVPRLLDFGLAKAMTRFEADQDQFGDSLFASLPFTPAWGAPEQWRRALGATGTWTDVHALALMSVELMSGAPPLQGQDTAQLMNACLDPTRRPTPRALGVAVSDAVEAVFKKALSVDPRERHRTAGLFWESFRRAAGVDTLHTSSWSLPAPPAYDASAGPNPTPHETISLQVTTASRPGPHRKSRWQAWWQLALWASALGLAFWVSRGRRTPIQQQLGSHVAAVNAAPSAPLRPPATAPSVPSATAPIVVQRPPARQRSVQRRQMAEELQANDEPDAPPRQPAQLEGAPRAAGPPPELADALPSDAARDAARLSHLIQENGLQHRK